MLKYKCICFVFFHTILTVEENTQIAHLSDIPECYNVYLVVFPSVPPLEGAFEHPQGTNTQIFNPIEVYLLSLLFLS